MIRTGEKKKDEKKKDELSEAQIPHNTHMHTRTYTHNIHRGAQVLYMVYRWCVTTVVRRARWLGTTTMRAKVPACTMVHWQTKRSEHRAPAATTPASRHWPVAVAACNRCHTHTHIHTRTHTRTQAGTHGHLYGRKRTHTRARTRMHTAFSRRTLTHTRTYAA